MNNYEMDLSRTAHQNKKFKIINLYYHLILLKDYPSMTQTKAVKIEQWSPV